MTTSSFTLFFTTTGFCERLLNNQFTLNPLKVNVRIIEKPVNSVARQFSWLVSI